MTGLVLSHFYVEPKDTDQKYSWIKKAINKNLNLNKKFYIVLCGHGVAPPAEIKELVDEVYWEENIFPDELGRGHPKFCIEGFKRCLNAGCEFTLKNRAYDYIENIKPLQRGILITEQSCLQQQIIGDLLMYGPTQYLFDWWSNSPWNYSINGMKNLYNNLPQNFYCDLNFISAKEIGWKTYEDNSNDYWGKSKGYEWHNGKGFLKYDSNSAQSQLKRT